MPTTYYDTANGRMRGQYTGSTSLDYLTDALGSVTATVDSTSAVQNTYRYKPYGQQLAKTGSGIDPKYLWTGDTGSRATGLIDSEQYNIRRHVSVNFGRWTSADPLWPREIAYAYCSCTPTVAVDPMGLAPTITRYKKNMNVPRCGGQAQVSWKFVVTGQPTGWIIQHIIRNSDAAMCDGTPPPKLPPECKDYFEAWPIIGGNIFVWADDHGWGPMSHWPDKFPDDWTAPVIDCASGGATIIGSLMFVASKNDPTSSGPSGMKRNTISCAGEDIYSGTKFPGFVAQAGTSAMASLSYGCCSGEKYECRPPGQICSNCQVEGPCRGPFWNVIP